MGDYFKCGVCSHTQSARVDDIWGLKADTGHMLDHYKYHHAELIGTYHPNPGAVAHQDYWEFKPIPADIAPVLHCQDSDSYPWDEVLKYTR